MKPYLEIDHVGISFATDDGPLQVLDSVNLKVSKGEFVSLIGHSGCGKSTVLNIVAGLLGASEGGVILEGREVTEPGPDRAVVFQNHSLLPWLTVYENVRLAVDEVFKRSKSRRERDAWTRHNLELVHMGHALDRKPDEISGGMKQRVGIARALAMEPKVLLLDEPFGALDSLTRTHLQDSLMEIHARLDNTVIMITHDVDEAVLLSDRIVMMTRGPAATVDTVLDIDIPRPRQRLELAEDPRYNHYRAEVVKFLHDRHDSAARREAPPAQRASVMDINRWRQRQRGAGGRVLEKKQLTLGFIPLTDCAPLVVAQEQGYFAKQGLDVRLSRESSWANIRDKVSVGMLDGAQMLAAMPLATACGIDAGAPMVTALSLGLNGNAITLSETLYQRMHETGEVDLDTPLGSARALRRVIEQNRERGDAPLVFASVFPFSSHNYLLRYWMGAAGIDPDRDVKLIVVPPPQMVHYLRAGVISGYCVGEPWNTQAVVEGLGRIVVTSYDLWNNHPEKVFGVSWRWAAENPNTHRAVLTALLQASAWIDRADNRAAVCDMLSEGRYVNAPSELLSMSMTGTLRQSAGTEPQARPDFNVFNRYAGNFPWRSHALWFLTQMVRWGQIREPTDLRSIAEKVYRPELYREVADGLGLPRWNADYKTEGGHTNPWSLRDATGDVTLGSDRFGDGGGFSPVDPIGYVAGFAVRDRQPALDAFAACNPSWPETTASAALAVEALPDTRTGEQR